MALRVYVMRRKCASDKVRREKATAFWKNCSIWMKSADKAIREIVQFVKRRYLFKDKEKAISRTRAYTNVRKRRFLEKLLNLDEERESALFRTRAYLIVRDVRKRALTKLFAKLCSFYHLFSTYSQNAYISLTSSTVPSSRVTWPFQRPWTW